MKILPKWYTFQVETGPFFNYYIQIIQDTIAEQRMTITKEEAVILFRNEIPEYIKNHDGKLPELSDPDPSIRRLAEAIVFVKNAKIRHMLKLESEKKGGNS